tara:strand:+ start:637 stop:783 length:147 start_codon:yes stop_codon:yes gene_type:complete
MFWKKKKVIVEKQFKKRLIEELARLRNDSLIIVKEIEKLIKEIREEKI